MRRFEAYASDRFQLDSQLLWNELTVTAPEQARRQVDTARTSVDFFVCLLCGHLAILLAAAVTLTSTDTGAPAAVTTAPLPSLLPSSPSATAAPSAPLMNGRPPSGPWSMSDGTPWPHRPVWTSRENSPPSARCGPWSPGSPAFHVTSTLQPHEIPSRSFHLELAGRRTGVSPRCGPSVGWGVIPFGSLPSSPLRLRSSPERAGPAPRNRRCRRCPLGQPTQPRRTRAIPSLYRSRRGVQCCTA